MIIIIAILIILLSFIPPIKCPKCNQKCKESYYLPGCNDSLFFECPEHGNINLL